MFGQYFPQMQRPVIDLVEDIAEIANAPLNANSYNTIYNALFTYVCSKTQFFGDEFNEYGDVELSSFQKRMFFVNEFPKLVIMSLRADLEKNTRNGTRDNALVNRYEFLKRISMGRAEKTIDNDIFLLKFKNIGQLTAI